MNSSILSRVKPHPDGGFIQTLTDTLLANAGSTADHFLRTWLSTRMLIGNMPIIPRLIEAEYRKKWEFYRDEKFIKKPETFFRKPDRSEPVIRPADPMDLPIHDAVYEDILFPSAFEPLNPDYHATDIFPGKQSPSIARLIRHKDGDRPTLIVVHGYVLDGYDFNARLFDIAKFYRLGFNILMYTMPYHGPRRKENAAFSGDGFMFFDAARINENVRWSIHDLTRYVDFLTARSKEPVGMMGFSLGGFHTALMASLDKRLAFAIPIVPVITLFNVILEWQPSAGLIKAFMAVTKLDRKDIESTLAPVSPLVRQPAIPRERILIVAGTGDRMAHPDHAQSLWEHWKHPKIYWFPGNHIVHFEKKHYMREIAAFLRGLRIF